MAGAQAAVRTSVHTVLGPVPAEDLGVAFVHEALLSVLPGAQYAYDVTIDRAQIFETLAAKLARFKQAGGGTIVDSSGMFHGRDLTLFEALSRATGVHIVGSTGMGPERCSAATSSRPRPTRRPRGPPRSSLISSPRKSSTEWSCPASSAADARGSSPSPRHPRA